MGKAAATEVNRNNRWCRSHRAVDRGGNGSMGLASRRPTTSANQPLALGVLALYVAHYNFCRRQSALRMTPAMAANVTGTLWSLEDLYHRVRV